MVAKHIANIMMVSGSGRTTAVMFGRNVSTSSGLELQRLP